MNLTILKFHSHEVRKQDTCFRKVLSHLPKLFKCIRQEYDNMYKKILITMTFIYIAYYINALGHDRLMNFLNIHPTTKP